MRRLSARHRGVITATGRAFGNRLRGVRPLSAEPRRRPGVGGAFISRPRAPRPCSTIKTPHDSALVEQDLRNISPLESVGISFLVCWEVVQAARVFCCRPG